MKNDIRAAACGGRKFGYELRASAPGRLRPANRYAIDPMQKARSRADGLATSSARMQPSARGRMRAAGRDATDFAGRHFHQTSGCGLPVVMRPILPAGISSRTAAAARSVLTDRLYRQAYRTPSSGCGLIPS